MWRRLRFLEVLPRRVLGATEGCESRSGAKDRKGPQVSAKHRNGGDEVSEARGKVHQNINLSTGRTLLYSTYAQRSLFIFFDECPIFAFCGLFCSSKSPKGAKAEAERGP